MPIMFVNGDPTLSAAQTLAFGHNARGRTELDDLKIALSQRYPAAFSTYARQCKKGRITAGQGWLWRESRPWLSFWVVRESSVGATRLRYVQAIVMNTVRDYRLEGLQSLAIAPMGQPGEWPEIKKILERWFSRAKFPVIAYESYQPGVQAAEDLLTGDAGDE